MTATSNLFTMSNRMYNELESDYVKLFTKGNKIITILSLTGVYLIFCIWPFWNLDQRKILWKTYCLKKKNNNNVFSAPLCYELPRPSSTGLTSNRVLCSASVVSFYADLGLILHKICDLSLRLTQHQTDLFRTVNLMEPH